MDGKCLGLQNLRQIKKIAMKLIENNFYTIYLKGRKTFLQGILISAGTEWILLRYIPVDYVLDGFLLIRTRYIKEIKRGANEIFNEKVIHLKLVADEKINDQNINLSNSSDVLYYLMQNQITIQFDFHDDSVTYVGSIKNIYTKTIQIQSMNPEGEWEEKESCLMERIRTIQFDNDYINSLIAYNKWLDSHQ